MKKILAFNGSARKLGNTSFLLNHFLDGAKKFDTRSEEIQAHQLNLVYCTGCLRCNLIKRCSIRNDDWNELSAKILESDVLVFATPVYFHHVSAQLKKIIDRFRSFVHVQITESGLKHTPHVEWEKDFVLLLSLGSSSDLDAQPVIELNIAAGAGANVIAVDIDDAKLQLAKKTRSQFFNKCEAS